MQENNFSRVDELKLHRLKLHNQQIKKTGSTIYTQLERNIDDFGMLAQLRPNGRRDGGDTLQREGMLALGIELAYRAHKIKAVERDLWRRRYEIVLDLLVDPKDGGNYRRHPNAHYWYGDYDRMSRDQLTPNVLAMGALGLGKRLLNAFISHYSRFGMTTNTQANYVYKNRIEHAKKSNVPWRGAKLADFTFVEFLGYFIRGHWLSSVLLYPVLWLSDLELLVNAAVKVIRSKRPTYNDDLNFLCALTYSLAFAPTPVGVLADWLYTLRNKPTPTPGYIETDPRIMCLNFYFEGRKGDLGPRLNFLWAPLIRYFLTSPRN